MKKKIFKVIIRHMPDKSPDASYLGEYTDDASDYAIDRRTGEFVKDLSEDDLPQRNGREYRFFLPSSNHIPHNPENWSRVQGEELSKVIEKYGSIEKADEAYAKEDFNRMESLENGNWYYLGIRAEAEVGISSDGKAWKLDKLTSGGLWGIESDSGKDYFADVESEELSQLSESLKAYGFGKRQIKEAIKNAEHKE